MKVIIYSQLYDYRKSRKIKQSIINHLINTNLLSQRVKLVCQDCLDQVSEPIKSLSSAQVVNEGFVPENHSMDDVNAAIPNEDITNISFSSENHVSNDLEIIIAKDIAKLHRERACTNMEYLVQYKPQDWLKERPDELVKLISVLCNLNPEHKASAFMLAKCIEQMYCCRNKKLVLPIGFPNNLLTYSLSNSKLLVNVNGSSMPAAGADPGFFSSMA